MEEQMEETGQEFPSMIEGEDDKFLGSKLDIPF
jgi:hypothetical protein